MLQFVPNGPTQLCTTVQIFEDNLIESFADENFVVELMSQPFERVEVMPDMAGVLIRDNDSEL